MTFTRGQLIADRFRLINPIGRGSLGDLWRAVDRVPDRQVAIRHVTRFDPVIAQRMVSEVDASRALHERCIARVHRAGMFDNGTAFIATELLLSESLDELLSRRARITPGAALTLVADLAAALLQAHERRLVHGAITPRAILLHRDDRGAITPKLVDFGRSAVLAPTFHYASPEQIDDEPGPRYATDVWALGVLLYRCVTGVLPFRQRTDPFEAQRIVREANVPEPLRNVLRGALEPDRHERITMQELAVVAQLASWRVSGGFADLEKMVRIHSPVWLDPAATGELTHCPTIPALGGSPPPSPSMAPVLSCADEAMGEEVEEIETGWSFPPEAPLPSTKPERPIAPPPLRIAPAPAPVPVPDPDPDPAPLPAATYPTPIPDEVFIDFRPRRSHRRVIAAGVGAAMIGLIAVLSLSSQKPRRARMNPARNLPAKVAERPTEAATVAAAVATVVPKVVAMVAPQAAAVAVNAVVEQQVIEKRAEKKIERAEKKAAAPPEKKVESKASSPYPIVGVPLWDPPTPVPAKKKAPVDDNPYE